MTFYLTWVKNETKFTPKIPPAAVDILTLSIQHQEGEFAEATITVPAHQASHKEKAFISYQNNNTSTLLFQGRLMEPPQYVDDQTVRLRLTAAPKDAPEKLAALLDASDISFDPLFAPASESREISEQLDSLPFLPHWCPRTGDVTLSHIIHSPHILDIGIDYFANSLKTHIKRSPIRQIKIDVEAQWLQKISGISDIGEAISAKCPGGKLETYSPKNMQQHWINPMRLNRHYTILKSTITPMHVTDDPLPIITMTPSVQLHWQHQQKRVETVTACLKNTYQDFPGNQGRTLNLKYCLEDITADPITPPWTPKTSYEKNTYILYGKQRLQAKSDHKSSDIFPKDAHKWKACKDNMSALGNIGNASFFDSPRGRQAIHHALDVAYTYLVASNRAFHINVHVPFDRLYTIDCTHMIRLKIGPQDIIGKVIAYKLIADGINGRWGEVTIAASIGTGEAMPELQADEERTKNGVVLKKNFNTSTHQGFPSTLSDKDFLQNINIQNHARDMPPPKIDANLQKNLSAHPTHITFELLDLSPVDVLSKTISVEISHPVTTEKQINIEEIGGHNVYSS